VIALLEMVASALFASGYKNNKSVKKEGEKR